jgi:MFS-type transporter involved in bile tolerance (Atg22 family)
MLVKNKKLSIFITLLIGVFSLISLFYIPVWSKWLLLLVFYSYFSDFTDENFVEY